MDVSNATAVYRRGYLSSRSRTRIVDSLTTSFLVIYNLTGFYEIVRGKLTGSNLPGNSILPLRCTVEYVIEVVLNRFHIFYFFFFFFCCLPKSTLRVSTP